MDSFGVKLTTERGDSVGARIVIDLDRMVVTLDEGPAVDWELAQVRADLADERRLAVSVPDEWFVVESDEAPRIARLLERPIVSPGERTSPGRASRMWGRVAGELASQPSTPLAWLLGLGVALATAATVWAILGG